jgi:5-hydroxyisourate hydrolase
MSGVSTHVLDTRSGEPASGIAVRLERADGGVLGRAITDADGRVPDFGVAALAAGNYRLVFETGPYLGAEAGGVEPFFPEVVVTFTADGRRPKYHVPLLLSPYSYATYRGS